MNRYMRLLLAMSLVVASAACKASDEQHVEALRAELAGRWAHLDIVAYEDPIMKTMIVSYGFTTFGVAGELLVESEEFCHTDQVTNVPIKTAISDAGTQAIKPKATPVLVTGTSGTLRVQRPATPTAVGIAIADASVEGLPSDPKDPRVEDADGDGNPGITVTVNFGQGEPGKLFIARREIFAYDMTQNGPDTLTGTVTDSSEQLILGSTNPALLTAGGQWTQVSNLAFSPIMLRRVDSGWDCDRLMAERDALFPPTPPIQW